MPQLMPLYWNISFLMLFYIVLVMVDFFEKFNEINMFGLSNVFILMNNSWKW